MNDQTKNKIQVAIAGGGPVGLFLACCLQKAGISCKVFEKEAGLSSIPVLSAFNHFNGII